MRGWIQLAENTRVGMDGIRAVRGVDVCGCFQMSRGCSIEITNGNVGEVDRGKPEAGSRRKRRSVCRSHKPRRAH